MIFSFSIDKIDENFLRDKSSKGWSHDRCPTSYFERISKVWNSSKTIKTGLESGSFGELLQDGYGMKSFTKGVRMCEWTWAAVPRIHSNQYVKCMMVRAAALRCRLRALRYGTAVFRRRRWGLSIRRVAGNYPEIKKKSMAQDTRGFMLLRDKKEATKQK